MRYYTHKEIVALLEIDTGFLDELEREEIIDRDAPAETAGAFSERMLERVRVADNLVHDLEVNLAGASIIVRMREDLSGLQHRIEGLLTKLRAGTTES